jgi:SAM-dependent methyltransferase
MPESQPRPLTFTRSFLGESRTALYTPATLKAIFSGFPDGASGPILDVGAGTGFFLHSSLEFLDLTNPYGVCLDPERSLLDIASEPSVVGSGEALPVATETIGVVLCHFVLSRVPHDVAWATLQEIARVMRPNAYFLAVEPCLALQTYHSPLGSEAGKLMAVARRMKVDYQREVNSINENFGIDLPDHVARLLDIQLVDLHVARWFTTFPEGADADTAPWMRRRASELQRRSSSVDFLNAHGSSAVAGIEPGPEIIGVADGSVRLTEAGFARLTQCRLEDLEHALAFAETGVRASGPIDLIPVVRVIGRKRSR